MTIAGVLDALRQIRANGAEVFMEGDAVLVRGTPQQRERAIGALRDYDFEEIAEGLAPPIGARPLTLREAAEVLRLSSRT